MRLSVLTNAQIRFGEVRLVMPIKHFAVQLGVIRMFLDRALSVYGEYVRVLDKEYTEEEWDEYGEAEYDEATDILLFYQEIVTRAALYELNALVEHELRCMAESIERKHSGEVEQENKRLNRGEARRIIEKEYGIKLQDLPRSQDVDEIRKIVNAYKHEDGYGSEYDGSDLIVEVQKRYELDPDEIPKYVDSVGEFLNALPGELSNLGHPGPKVRLSEEMRKIMKMRGRQ
jgi:DNA-directed RNA polymerase subunit H (RpoH/RPB5)